MGRKHRAMAEVAAVLVLVMGASLGNAGQASRSASGELFSRNLGIASADDRLFRTGNAGRSWTDITPGSLGADDRLDDIEFSGSQRGWIVTNDCVAADAFVYRTQNGGSRWRRSAVSPVGCAAGATHFLEFVGRARGWLVEVEPTGSHAELRRTTNAGRTWSDPTELPALGRVSFRDRRNGFLAGYLTPANRFYVTKNGGGEWDRRTLRRPPNYQNARMHIDVPTFRGGVGILPVTLIKNGRKDMAFYKSRNGGRTWRPRILLQPRVPNDRGRIETISSSVVTKNVWWVIAGDRPKVFVTRNGGGTWAENRGDLPGGGTISGGGKNLSWVTVFGNNDRPQLFRTRDGGKNWTRLRPNA